MVDFRTTVMGRRHRAGRQDSFPKWEDLFVDSMELALTDGLPAGEHRMAVAFDVPKWLPPAFEGDGFSIEHSFAARLIVQWGIDPTQRFAARVLPAPVDEVARPVLFRSPPSFHEQLLLEVALDSAVVGVKDALRGKIALRSGFDVPFEAVEMTLVSAATSTLFDGVRTKTLGRLSIDAAPLRRGQDASFVFPPAPKTTPTFDTRLIAHGWSVDAQLVGVRWRNPTVSIPVKLLPNRFVARSGDAVEAVLGRGRIEHHAASMARVTGLRTGTGETLVEGKVGHVEVRIDHAPREGEIAVHASFRFPSLELGLRLSRRGVFDKLRSSVPLPQALADRYVLRSETVAGVMPVDRALLGVLVANILHGVFPNDEVVFTDDALGIHRLLTVDTTDEIEAIGAEMKARAARIADAAARLPFNAALPPASAASWIATAAEQEAFLVPHVPALQGIALHARVDAGETKSLPVTLRLETHTDASSALAAKLDCRELPLPDTARIALESACTKRPRGLEPVWSYFGSIVVEDDSIMLTTTHGRDPRDALPPLQALFDWILAIRGERKAALPYR